jgi:hypothetical protein
MKKRPPTEARLIDDPKYITPSSNHLFVAGCLAGRLGYLSLWNQTFLGGLVSSNVPDLQRDLLDRIAPCRKNSRQLRQAHREGYMSQRSNEMIIYLLFVVVVASAVQYFRYHQFHWWLPIGPAIATPLAIIASPGGFGL